MPLKRFPRGSKRGGQFRKTRPVPPKAAHERIRQDSSDSSGSGLPCGALLKSFDEVQALITTAKRKSEVDRLMAEYATLDPSERPTSVPTLSGRVLDEIGPEGRQIADWAHPDVAAIAAFMKRREMLYRKHDWKRKMGLLPYDDYPLNLRAFLPSYFRQ